MIDKVKIKAIIKQYADKGERLYNESCETKQDSQTISYWDGYGDCANLLLRELDDMQEEPVSEKPCMYSKDNYTDEDRKVLCYGCKEECKFNKKEEPINDSFEIEVKNLWMEINTGHSYSIVDSYNLFYGLCMDIAQWQKEQLMAKAVDATVHIDAGGYPYIPQIELYDYDKDIPLAKEGDKYKVILIKEE